MKAFIALALVVLLAACAPESIVCPDGTVVTDAADCPIPEMAPDTPPQQETIVIEEPEPEPEVAPEPPRELAKELVDLKEKAAKLQSYAFSYAILPENKAEWKFLVRGDKVKILLKDAIVTDERTHYDTVYLDRTRKKATGYCEQTPAICKDTEGKKIAELNYEDYVIEYPQDVLADIDYAEYKGSITIEGNIALIFEFERDGEYYRITAHKFFGIPMREEIFSTAAYEGETTGHIFRDMAFNSVSEADVTPPEGY